MAEISRAIDGIPVVGTTTERDSLFPSATRAVDQRVYNKELRLQQRWDGSAWQTEISANITSFNVDDYAVSGDVDDTERIRRACDEMKAAGGGRLVGKAGKKYVITPMRITAGLHGGNTGLGSFDSTSGARGVEIVDLELDASTTDAAWANSYIWFARDCSVATRRCKFYSTRRGGSGGFDLNPIAAAEWLTVRGGCKDIVVEDCDLSNLIAWLYVKPLEAGDGSVRTRKIKLNRVTGDDVAYPIECQGNGDDVEFDYEIRRPHRAFVFTSHDGYTDAPSNIRGVCRVTDPGEKASIAWSCKDVSIRYVEKGSTAAADKPKVALQVQGAYAPQGRDIEIIFDIEYGASGQGGPAFVMHKTTDGSTADTAARGSRIDRLRIGGVITGTPVGDVPCIQTYAGSAFGPGDSLYGVKIDVLVKDSWIRWAADSVKDVLDFGQTSCALRGMVVHADQDTAIQPRFAKTDFRNVTALNKHTYRDAAGAIHTQLGGITLQPLMALHTGANYSLGRGHYGKHITNSEAGGAIVVVMPNAEPGEEFAATRIANFAFDLTPVFTTTLSGAHSAGATTINCQNTIAPIGPGATVVINGETRIVDEVTGNAQFTITAGLTGAAADGAAVTRTQTIRGGAAGDVLRLNAVGVNASFRCIQRGIWDFLSRAGDIQNVTVPGAWP